MDLEIDDDGNGDCCFRCGYGDDENREKNTIQFPGPYVFVKGNEVQTYAVQDEFDAHEQGDQIPSSEETEHADEKKSCADE